MTPSVLKQDPFTLKVQNNSVYYGITPNIRMLCSVLTLCDRQDVKIQLLY